MDLRKNKNIKGKSIKERLLENIEKESLLRKQNMQKEIDSKRYFDEEENSQFIKARDASQHLKIAKKRIKNIQIKIGKKKQMLQDLLKNIF